MSHTLLLADDSLTIQRVIELTFADEDVNVVAVSDGDEAIAVMDRNPPDIVLADVGMPGRNGYQVAEHIRDTPRLAHIPIVLLTGAFEPIDQAKATAAGCDGVLAKPFEPQLVIGRVRELLSKPKHAIAIASTLPTLVASSPSWPQAAPESPNTPRANAGDAGDYFERLDQAFANLSARQDDASKEDTLPPSGASALDWFAAQPPAAETQGWNEPTLSSLIESAAAKTVDAEETGKVVPSESAAPLPDNGGLPQTTPSTPPGLPYSYAPPPDVDAADSQAKTLTPAPVPMLPPLADAFVALLAAEQAFPSPIAAPVWPSAPQSLSPTPAAITDDVVERIVKRVLDQLSDRALREAVDEKVSTIAERLIRDEIDRIKASLK